MERRKFTREFKLEAVKLVKDRGVSYARVAEDLGVHPTQLRNWVKALADDPEHSFPGQGQMKPEQSEIGPRPISRRNRREVRFHCEAPGGLAGGMVVRGARCLARWVLCMADKATQPTRPEQRGSRREGSRQLPSERPDLWCQAGVARHPGGRRIVWSASD